jgi:hypothetical protein
MGLEKKQQSRLLGLDYLQASEVVRVAVVAAVERLGVPCLYPTCWVATVVAAEVATALVATAAPSRQQPGPFHDCRSDTYFFDFPQALVQWP